MNAQQEIYNNSFESTPINVQQYIGNPTMHANIISSQWTSLSGNAFSQENGNTGNALGLSHNGEMTYILTLTVASGKQIDLTAFNFWRKKSKASMGWKLKINQVEVANGTSPVNGASLGYTSFSSPMNNLTGIIDIEITIDGTGNGTFSLDDFVLYGATTVSCPELNFSTPNNVACASRGMGMPIFLEDQNGMSVFSGMYQWKILDNGNYVPLTNNGLYSGTTSMFLVINNVPLSFDGNQYICEVTMSDGCVYVSDPIILNVYPIPQSITIQFNN